MKDYSYLFDGSKLYCYFTEEEKEIYLREMRLRKKKRERMKTIIVYFLSFSALAFSIMDLIMQVLMNYMGR